MSYDLVTGTDPSFFKINRQRGLLIRTNAHPQLNFNSTLVYQLTVVGSREE